MRTLTLPRILMYLALGVGVVVFAYPFVWMALAALKPEAEIAALSPVPSRWTLESYRLVFDGIPLGRAFWNSALVTGLVTGLALFFGSVTAYALSRLQWRGREAAFALILFVLVLPIVIYNAVQLKKQREIR